MYQKTLQGLRETNTAPQILEVPTMGLMKYELLLLLLGALRRSTVKNVQISTQERPNNSFTNTWHNTEGPAHQDRTLHLKDKGHCFLYRNVHILDGDNWFKRPAAS